MTGTRASLAHAVALMAGSVQAHAAVTQRVKDAFREEYLAYCSAYAVGSQELRACMDKAQDQLSQRCLQELVAAGGFSKSQIIGYKSRHHQ
jgi:1,6-anhydro-N-acetylmuramate kinase